MAGKISYRVLLVWGRFCVSETIIPETQEHFLTPSARRDTHLFGGLRVIGESSVNNAVIALAILVWASPAMQHAVPA